MATFFLGPLEAHDIVEIRRALQAQLDYIEDVIDILPVMTVDQARDIATEQAKLGRLIDACDALALSE